jgi:hypothetical protein
VFATFYEQFFEDTREEVVGDGNAGKAGVPRADVRDLGSATVEMASYHECRFTVDRETCLAVEETDRLGILKIAKV